MKKGIVVIVAVAILGLVGFYASDRGHSKSNSSSQSANNSTQTNDTSMVSDQKPATPVTYKDGTYTGSNQDTVYGPVQVAAVVSGGKISDINFLKMPEDRGTSTQLTQESEPLLKNSAINKQSAHIDFVSGATITSQGYEQSLQAALDQAAQG